MYARYSPDVVCQPVLRLFFKSNPRSDPALRALALGQEEGEVIVEVWNRRALL